MSVLEVGCSLFEYAQNEVICEDVLFQVLVIEILRMMVGEVTSLVEVLFGTFVFMF